MRITGAVLEEIGRGRPYVDTRPISVCEVDLAAPGPGEVLIAVEAAGVCHSDLSVVDGNRVRPVPMLLGHEAAGIVVETGPSGSDLKPGQRVVMTFLPRCTDCAGCASDGQLPCEPGTVANNAGRLLHAEGRLTRHGERIHHHLGVSAFADHVVVDRASVVAVPDDVPADIAAVLGCAVLTGGGAVLNAARPRQEDSLMIVGLGGVGMAAVITAVALGVSRIVAVDAVTDKLATARALGAHETLAPEAVDEAGIRTTHAVECAGNARAFELAFRATAPGGRTVTVGLPNPDATAEISPLTVTAEARQVIGCYLGSAVPSRDIPRYVEMWRAGRLPVEKLISHHIGLDQINQAMDDLAEARALRQIITF